MSTPSWPTTDAERVEYANWQYEVANGDTTLGYRHWAALHTGEFGMLLVPEPRHYVLLTDSDNDCLLVSCADAAEAVALSHATVWSDGGVSAWLWPEDCIRLNADILREFEAGADIGDVMATRQGTANPVKITEHAPKEPTDA